ncbi:hypothetical protein TKK_0000204 [Trichogramma kaykai]
MGYLKSKLSSVRLEMRVLVQIIKKYKAKKNASKKGKKAKRLKKEVDTDIESSDLLELELSEVTENIDVEKSEEFEQALENVRTIQVRVTDTRINRSSQSEEESMTSESESASDAEDDFEKITFLRRMYNRKSNQEKQPNVRKRQLDKSN